MRVGGPERAASSRAGERDEDSDSGEGAFQHASDCSASRLARQSLVKADVTGNASRHRRMKRPAPAREIWSQSSTGSSATAGPR